MTWCENKVKLPLTPGEFESWADSSWADVKPSKKLLWTNPLSGRKRRETEKVCNVCVIPSLTGVLGRSGVHTEGVVGNPQDLWNWERRWEENHSQTRLYTVQRA